MRVSFTAGHTVSRLTNSPSGCDTSDAHIRCDDPLDLSPNGIAAPVIQSTFVLNALQVQVCSGTCSTTPAWQTLRTYDLSYEQGGPLTITDPATGKSESTAGYLDLTKVQELGDDGATALPTLTFGYTAVPEDYEDDAFTPNPSTNCGFSWNTSGSGCLLWSKAYAGSNRYLEISDNGLGMRETFIWSHARNNTHGVNGGGSNTANPLYCDTYQTGYPCDEADDQNWSREVLTESDSSVVRTAQAGQGGTQTSTTITSKTAYTYTLTYPLVAQMCSDCVAGMYWGNQTDEDYLDYYNGKFMGFAQARVAAPDGSVQVHKYDATEGYGVYDVSQACPSGWSCVKDPWWDLTNLAHGRQVEEDDYDTNGTTLLAKSLTYYQAVCPPSGVAGSPVAGYGNWNGNLVSELDHDNPVGVCDVQTAKVYDYTYDGSASPTYASSAYTYDTSGRVTQTTDTDNGGSPWQIVHQTAYIWNNAINTNVTEPNPPTGTYILARVAYHAVKDINGTTRYACSEHGYDGHAYTTGQNAGLTQGDLTSHSDFAAGCGNSGNGWAPSGPITSGRWCSRASKRRNRHRRGNRCHDGAARPGVLSIRVRIIQGRFIPGPARLTSPSGKERGLRVIGAPQVNYTQPDMSTQPIMLLDVRGLVVEDVEPASTLVQDTRGITLES
jgi:hypothetical protein